MLEQGLFQLIQSDAGVSSVVSMTNGKGIYWILAPKGSVYPCIVLGRVATNDVYTTEGNAGIREGIFQVDCYASTFLQSREVANAVRALLESYLGNLPDTDSTAVASVMTSKDWDMPYEEGSTGFVFRAMLEFRIWYYDSTLPITPVSGEPAIIDGGSF